MDRNSLERMVVAGNITTNAVLKQTPLDDLDAILRLLRRHRPVGEVCAALLERIATAPLSELSALKGLYFRHCGAQQQ